MAMLGSLGKSMAVKGSAGQCMEMLGSVGQCRQCRLGNCRSISGSLGQCRAVGPGAGCPLTLEYYRELSPSLHTPHSTLHTLLVQFPWLCVVVQ